jgi:hypothetical protein
VNVRALELQIQEAWIDLDHTARSLYLLPVRGDWLLATTPKPGARKIGEFTKHWFDFDKKVWVALKLVELRDAVFETLDEMRPA